MKQINNTNTTPNNSSNYRGGVNTNTLFKSLKSKVGGLSSTEMIILFVVFTAIAFSIVGLITGTYASQKAKSHINDIVMHSSKSGVTILESSKDSFIDSLNKLIKNKDDKLNKDDIDKVIVSNDHDIPNQGVSIVFIPSNDYSGDTIDNNYIKLSQPQGDAISDALNSLPIISDISYNEDSGLIASNGGGVWSDGGDDAQDEDNNEENDNNGEGGDGENSDEDPSDSIDWKTENWQNGDNNELGNGGYKISDDNKFIVIKGGEDTNGSYNYEGYKWSNTGSGYWYCSELDANKENCVNNLEKTIMVYNPKEFTGVNKVSAQANINKYKKEDGTYDYQDISYKNINGSDPSIYWGIEELRSYNKSGSVTSVSNSNRNGKDNTNGVLNFIKSYGYNNYNEIYFRSDNTKLEIRALFCDNLALGGYDDWYLPSIQELGAMYKVNEFMKDNVDANDTIINFNKNSTYWSSTARYTDQPAYNLRYQGYQQGSNGIKWAAGVRCIRQVD